MITVSLVILTYHRWPSVKASLSSNLKTAGYPISEIIHVDNGSGAEFCDFFTDAFDPAVQVRHSSNRGVAVGYNRGLALANSSHVVITGCDRVMPNHWLRHWVDAFENIPELGVVSCYTGRYPERDRTGPGDRNGIKVRRAIPVEARMHSKAFLFETGFFREDFGLYGYEDAEWSDRAEKTAARLGRCNYVLEDMPYARHLEDNDGPEGYRPFKNNLHASGGPKALWLWAHHSGSPHYNPYARVEPSMVDTALKAEQARGDKS